MTTDIESLIDRQRFGWFSLKVLVLLFIATFTDGYDLQAAALAAPGIIKDWGVPRAALTPMLSASLAGMLIGTPSFGWIGDRFGRKRATVLGCLICGVFTLGCVWASSLEQLMVLRFFAGIGIGGVLPNSIALSAELSPRRIRARLTILMFIGITAGGGTPGLVARYLVPIYGWKVIFLIGGLAPIAIALLLALALPESLTFLALRRPGDARLQRLIGQLDPALGGALPPSAIPTVAASRGRAGFRDLLAGPFGVITPLLWLAFASVLLTIYLLTSWLPVVLESNGLPAGQAALYTTGFQLGGSVGGLVVSFLLDRFGLRLVTFLFIVSGASVLAIAGQDLSDTALSVLMGVAGFCILGLQFGLNATAGMLYPTALRATGVGVALAVGRFGSIAGPQIGGLLIAAGLASTRNLFLVPLIPLALGTIAAALLTWLGSAARRAPVRQATPVS